MTAPVGLLDTSIFIARESERPLGDLPARGYASHGEMWCCALSPRSGGSDVHAWALADRFEALQDGDVAGAVAAFGALVL